VPVFIMRNALFVVALSAFFAAVGLGVYTANKYFNDIVLPERPVYLFNLTEQESGVMQIELLGETLAADLPVAKDRADRCLRVAEQKWQEIKTNPLVNEQAARVKRVMREQWNAWMSSDKVRAFYQRIKE